MASSSFNVLSICSGIGGLDLAIRRVLPSARTVCYVEREVYCAAILAARMEDDTLDAAPIWSDLGTFDGRPWRGIVDCVIAGLQCQPYSVAGKQLGDRDERYIWPIFFRILEEVRAPMVFLENVPGLLRWFRPIGERLCDLGYELEAGIFSAAEVGASHRRERLFVLAHTHDARLPQWTETTWLDEHDAIERGRNSLANSGRSLRDESGRRDGTSGADKTKPGDDGEPLADASHDGRSRSWIAVPEPDSTPGPEPDGRDSRSLWRFPPGPGDHGAWEAIIREQPDLAPAIKREVRRVDVRTSVRVDQLRALGNTVLPKQAAHAWRTLMRRFDGHRSKLSTLRHGNDGPKRR